jgi:hypothetical protein
MSDDPSFCTEEADIFAAPGRELIFRVARPYLENEGILGAELIFGRVRQKSLVDDGARLSDMAQRIANVQSQQTRQPAAERSRDLMGLVQTSMRLVEAQAKHVPANQVVTGALLSQLAAEDVPRGLVRAGILFASALNMQPDWAAKGNLCLDLLEGGASGEAHGLADQTLAEIFRIKPAEGLFGDLTARLAVIETCLYCAGDAKAAVKPTAFMARLLAVSKKAPLLLFLGAVRGRLQETLAIPNFLSSEEPMVEWRHLIELKVRVAALPAFAGDKPLLEMLARRFNRLATPEALNPMLAALDEFGRKALLLATLFREVVDPGARSNLITSLAFHIDHRDFRRLFVARNVSPADAIQLANELDQALQNEDIPEHRRTRFQETILALIAEIRSGDSRRAAPVTSGPNDVVILNQQKMRLMNWSPLGLQFGPCKMIVGAGDKLKVTVSLNNPGTSLSFEAVAEVLRVADGIVAAKYKCADPKIEQQIKALFAG